MQRRRPPALIECERPQSQARELMKKARDSIERDFHMTRLGPIELHPFGSFPPDGGGQRQSESNKRELKPGHRCDRDTERRERQKLKKREDEPIVKE